MQITMGFLVGWSREEYLELIGIIVSSVIAIILFFLQRRVSAKQKIDHRLEIEREIEKKLYDIRYNDSNSKVQLYNVRLLTSKKFSANRRSILWGYPYHSAELYAANFDGLEFVDGIEEWDGERYHRVGLISYDRILSVRPEGDGSFNGPIYYVRPKLLQLDKYSIAYKSFRYYLAKAPHGDALKKPLKIWLRQRIKSVKKSIRRMSVRSRHN